MSSILFVLVFLPFALCGRASSIARTETQLYVSEAALLSGVFNTSVVVYSVEVPRNLTVKYVVVDDNLAFNYGFDGVDHYYLSLSHQLFTKNVNEYRQFVVDTSMLHCDRSRCSVRQDQSQRKVLSVQYVGVDVRLQ